MAMHQKMNETVLCTFCNVNERSKNAFNRFETFYVSCVVLNFLQLPSTICSHLHHFCVLARFTMENWNAQVKWLCKEIAFYDHESNGCEESECAVCFMDGGCIVVKVRFVFTLLLRAYNCESKWEISVHNCMVYLVQNWLRSRFLRCSFG